MCCSVLTFSIVCIFEHFVILHFEEIPMSFDFNFLALEFLRTVNLIGFVFCGTRLSAESSRDQKQDHIVHVSVFDGFFFFNLDSKTEQKT